MTGAADPTRLLAVLRLTAATLEARQQRWALVGGLAVSIRCEPRFTRDIDLAVAVGNDAEAEALVAHLLAAGYRLRLSLEHRALDRLAAIRLSPPREPDEGIVVDLLFASSGIEADICAQADRIALPGGLSVPVAQTGHLVATKLLAIAPDRPQDGVDLHSLRAQLTEPDRDRARRAVARIEALGANRGRPLRADLERWLDPGSR